MGRQKVEQLRGLSRQRRPSSLRLLISACQCPAPPSGTIRKQDWRETRGAAPSAARRRAGWRGGGKGEWAGGVRAESVVGRWPMTGSEPDTEELLRRAGAGDWQARGAVLQQQRQRLRRMVAARLDPRLGARVDASDVVQEALAEA